MFFKIHSAATDRAVQRHGARTQPARESAAPGVRLAPTRSAFAGTALRKSAAAAVKDQGCRGRAPDRRVMEILMIASGGERSRLGVSAQNHACWLLSVLKNTNDDEQDPGSQWVLTTACMRALPDPGHIQLQKLKVSLLKNLTTQHS